MIRQEWYGLVNIGEPDINVEIAAVLDQMSHDWTVVSHPMGEIQQIGKIPSGRKHHDNGTTYELTRAHGTLEPDIWITKKGSLPVIIEHEFEPGRSVEQEARDRLKCETRNKRKIDSVIAIKTPKRFKNRFGGQKEIQRELVAAQDISYTVYSPNRFPKKGWLIGSLADIAQTAMAIAVPKNEIDDCVGKMLSHIDEMASIIRGSGNRVRKSIARILSQSENEQTWRMAGLILSNAFMFHSHIGGEYKIKTLGEMQTLDTIPVHELIAEWQRIVRDVNYYPVFDVARRILQYLNDAKAEDIIRILRKMTSDINRRGLAGSTDLYGSVIQEMISDRKTLASFYTRPPSAELLAGLAAPVLGSDEYRTSNKLRSLRIGDFACGTGTLLTALYRRIAFGYEHANTNHKMAKLHASMMADSIYGLDVLPSATHLTVSALTEIYPKSICNNTHIVKMPFHINSDGSCQLGSLDLIMDQTMLDMAGAAITSAGEEPTSHQIVQNFDIVIMNPPYTSNTKGGEDSHAMFSFFGTSRDCQRKMANVQKLRFRNAKTANGNAGEASYFFAIAHKKIKPGGVIALVLPSTIAWGDSWSECRKILATSYDNVVVISIAAGNRPDMAFSFGTNMGEVLVVARKKRETDGKGNDEVTLYKNNEKNRSARGRFVVLNYTRPGSVPEAYEVCKLIRREQTPPPVEDPLYRYKRLEIGGTYVGSMLDCPLDGGWWWHVATLDPTLVQFAYGLTIGKFRLPKGDEYRIPMTRAGQSFGVVSRSISDCKKNDGRAPFTHHPIIPNAEYPILMNNDAKRQTRMIYDPDAHGIPKNCVNKDHVNRIANTARRLHINMQPDYSAQKVLYPFTIKKTLGSSAFPCYEIESKYEKAIALWGNSSLGVLTFWIHAGKQQLARGKTSKTAMEMMPVLDVSKLTNDQISHMNNFFDELSPCELHPINRMYKDSIRHKIDDAVLKVLNINDNIQRMRIRFSFEPQVRKERNDPELDKLSS